MTGPERRLKRAFHEASFMRGQTTPAAKHLFDAIHAALKELREARERSGQ